MQDGSSPGLGRELAHYRLVDLLGVGGMGEVYRATDAKLARDVAIKVLPEKVVRDEKRLARFEREARVLASLNHPNIATIYGLEEAGDQPFLVLELVEGQDLEERLGRGPIPVPEALAIARQMARALEEAHKKGIVHRDLKPANVKLAPDGTVKVLDFGLARVLEGGEDGAPPEALSQSPTQQQTTTPGAILGTVAYMSPEQARGLVVDKRSDIWAFGVVLFEMLTGRRLFEGGTASDTLAAVLEREVDWDTLPGAVPDGMRRLLRRCLQKDRDRRLHDIADARIELDDTLPEPSPREPGQPREGVSPAHTRRSLPTVWIALVAVLAAALAASLLWRAGEDPMDTRVTRTVIPLPAEPPGPPEGIGGPAQRFGLAISPDGSLVAYTTGRLYLRHLDRLEPTAIEGTAGAYHPFFSADSRWLGFLARERGLRKVSVTGGAPVTLGRIAADGGLTWSPTGTIITGSGQSIGGLQQLEVDGDSPQGLFEPDIDAGHFNLVWPQVLPEGDDVLVTVAHSEMEDWDEALIGVFRHETGQLRVVAEGGHRARYSHTGHLVYLQGNSLLAARFDRATLAVTGTPIPVLEGVSNVGEFEISEEGTLLYAPGDVYRVRRRLLLVDRGGETARVLAEGRGFHHPRFSPDGQRVAYGTGGVTADIRVLDLERGTRTAVTTRWSNGWVRWTPDGRHVVFGSTRSGQWNAHRRLADGSGDIEHLLATDYVSQPFGAADGLVLWQENRAAEGNRWDLLLRSQETNAVVRPFLATSADEYGPDLSPDRAWAAYQSDESGRHEVYLRPFPEGAGQWPVSVEGGRDARWSRNGREIFYLQDDTMMVVEVQTSGDSPRLATPRPLFERPISRALMGNNYDVAPDGQTFVIVEEGDPPRRPDHLVLVQNFDQELRRLAPVD